jgi:hypothetical protein
MSKKKVFMAPVSNENAYSYFENTVLSNVPAVNSEAVWGVGEGQSAQWKKAKKGDYLLFYPGDFKFTYAAKVVKNEKDKKLGEKLWDNYVGDAGRRSRGRLGPWEHLLFLEKPLEIRISSVKVQNFAGYSRDYPQNFQAINQKGHTEIRRKYGDVDDFIKSIRV